MPDVPLANAEVLHRSLAVALDEQLPDRWHVYRRKDVNPVQGEVHPSCLVIPLPERILEVETDNRALIGYPFVVLLQVQEAGVERDKGALVALRREAQKAVYTTSLPGVEVGEAVVTPAVEWVSVEEGVTIPIPTVEDKMTATGFTVIVGVLEEREAA